MNNYRMFARAVAPVLLLGACVGSDNLLLDVGNEDHPRYAELRARLAVSIAFPEDDRTYELDAVCTEQDDRLSPCCNATYCSARGLARFLAAACDYDTQAATNPVGAPDRAAVGACSAAIRTADSEMCVAQRLLRIIEDPGDSPIPARPLSGSTEFTFVSLIVGPQDPETNTELAREAVRRLALVQARVGDALNWFPPATVPPTCSVADFNLPAFVGGSLTDAQSALTQVEELANFYIEAGMVADEAMLHIEQASAAVSDSFFSTAEDRAETAALRNAPFASRLHAAHVLIGGTSEFPALGATARTEGLFTRPPLSRNGAHALEVLRMSAISPAFVQSPTLTVDQLLAGGGVGMLVDDSIAYRLSLMLDEPALSEASYPNAVDLDMIYERLGFSREDLAEARAWVDEEIRAFDRPAAPDFFGTAPRGARVLAAERMRNGNMTPFRLFSATRLPPESPSPAYWAAMVRYDETLPSAGTSFPTTWPGATPTTVGTTLRFAPGATWGTAGSPPGGTTVTVNDRTSGRTFASMREDAAIRARTLVNTLQAAGASAAIGRAQNILAGPLPEGFGGGGSTSLTGTGLSDGSLLGRARACTRASQLRIELDLTTSGITSPSGIEVVLGAQALSCAVDGTEDGVPCTTARLTARMPTIAMPLTAVAGSPGMFVATFAQDTNTGPRPPREDGTSGGVGTTAAFVVRRSPDLTGPRTPGEYEALIGFVLPSNNTNTARCVGAPITPDLDVRVAGLVAASPLDPARSEMDCSGLPHDMLIPLENELTEDGIAHESSWRGYLASARSAANTSDALAEELVRLGLEMDLRAEHEGDELERLCGVRINLSEFARTLPDRVIPVPATGCGAAYALVSGTPSVCVLDPIRYAVSRGAVRPEDVARLEQCIGSQAVAPTVALGDQPVCMWQFGGDPSTICRGATTTMPCPAVRLGAVRREPPLNPAEDCRPQIPAGAEPILISDPNLLNLFTYPPPPRPTGGSGGSETLPCDVLARIRARPAAGPHPSFEEDAELQGLLRSGLVRPDDFRRVARQLGWAPQAGDFSRVTFGGTTIASTGWPGVNPGPPDLDGVLWPAGPSLAGFDVIASGLCAGDPMATPTTDPGASAAANRGLFCLGNIPTGDSETSRVARARMNDLLARAVIAARVISGVGLADRVSVPYMPRVDLSDPGNSAARPHIIVEDDYAVDSDAGYFRAYSGYLALDQDDDAGGAVATDFGAIHATAEWLNPGTVFWSSCAYDGGCSTTPIGSGTGLGVFDGRAVFLARRLDQTVDVSGATTSDSGVFFNTSGRTGGALEVFLRGEARGISGRYVPDGFGRLGAPNTILLSDLTEYFERGYRVGFDTGHGCGGRRGCSCDERVLACIAGNPDTDVRSTYDGNLAFIGGEGLTVDDILNGMELVCAAARVDSPDADLNCDAPPANLTTLGNMLQAEAFLQCQADAISESASASVVTNLPQSVVDALNQDGPTSVGGSSGDIAAAVARLRMALFMLSEARSGMADQIDMIAAAIEELRTEIGRSNIAREIEELNLVSQVLNQVTSCATALIGTSWSNPQSFGGAGVVCGNAVAQSVLAGMVSQLSEQAEVMRLQGVFAVFDQRVNGLTSALRGIALGVSTQISEIDAALAEINGARSAARRALARALFLETDGTGAHMGVSAVYRNRFNTTLVRYTRARTRAVRAAYIARRAVEQRLAMPLETITDDLPTVEAPYRWADTLCRIPALDYGSLMRPTDTEGDPGPEGPTGYADTFIGDYVDRLEEVVNSYSFVFPFHEGTDTAVISLRDDMFSTRAQCEVPVPNLLLRSENLDARPGTSGVGWEPRGCICPEAGAACTEGAPSCCGSGCVDLESDPLNCGFCGHQCGAGAVCDGGSCFCLGAECTFTDVSNEPDAHCASAGALDEGQNPPSSVPEGAGSDYGIASGFEVTFGGSAAADLTTRLAQDVFLDGGTYRISWYGRQPTESYVDPAGAVTVTDDAGGSLLDTHARASVSAGSWTRYHHFFRVPRGQTVEVALRPGWTSPSLTTSQRLWVAGLMIENVTGTVTGDFYRMVPDPSTSTTRPLNEVYQPGPYFGTGETGTRFLGECPDTDGAVFRTRWDYGCTRVCPDGYDSECSDFVASSRCYHQTSFPFDSNHIESLLTSTPTGFASGNYNYRVDSLAVNVVGVGIRECDGTEPGCFASGNVSYSLHHLGEYPVVNARGETYFAPLFPGRLESARALLAERYITNPVSAADESLLGGYQRLEFAGRPLAGTVILRIWDEPALNFDRIEDVQLILNYRYWTHQR